MFVFCSFSLRVVNLSHQLTLKQLVETLKVGLFFFSFKMNQFSWICDSNKSVKQQPFLKPFSCLELKLSCFLKGKKGKNKQTREETKTLGAYLILFFSWWTFTLIALEHLYSIAPLCLKRSSNQATLFSITVFQKSKSTDVRQRRLFFLWIWEVEPWKWESEELFTGLLWFNGEFACRGKGNGCGRNFCWSRLLTSSSGIDETQDLAWRSENRTLSPTLKGLEFNQYS